MKASREKGKARFEMGVLGAVLTVEAANCKIAEQRWPHPSKTKTKLYQGLTDESGNDPS